MKLSQLSAGDLHPIDAVYISRSGPEDLPAIHLRLQGLRLDDEEGNGAEEDEDGGKDISIRLDHIPVLPADPRRLAGRRFAFAINPASPYIDGSVYLQGRHHAVDVTALDFKAIQGLQLPMQIEGCILLEEQAQPLAFCLHVPLHLPLDKAAMLALLDAGVQATGAGKAKDMGQLMAYLKQHMLYPEQLGEMAALAKARLQGA